MLFKKYQAKWWTNRTMQKNIHTAIPVDCERYIHSTDKMTLAALKKIPLFDKTCSKVITLLNEPQRRIIDLSGKIQITEHQLPRIYRMVQSICSKIGIEMPDLYLKLDRNPNAYTYGTEKFSIIIHSGLLECLQDDEIYAVLAHECGHIACNHVLYHTIGSLLLNGGIMGIETFSDTLRKTLVGSIVTSTVESSLELAFFHWQRCSELSADRVAVICCGSADPVIKSMMRLAGGTIHHDSGLSQDLFIAQAEAYKHSTEENKVNKALEFWLTQNDTHPRLAVRAYEAREFASSELFLNAENAL